MLLVGDVAIAEGDRFDFQSFPDRLMTLPWCVNLEGPVLNADEPVPLWGTHNTVDWLRSFEGLDLGPICIANNHIHDLPHGVKRTKKFLQSLGLQSFGAGDLASVERPAVWEGTRDHFAFIGFGWPVIGCKPMRKESSGVNAFEGRAVLRQLETGILQYPDSNPVVVIHGNYEFEPYPQPGHRSLARTLIDSGAYAVIFHHPHIVGPVERYKGRTIAYSLGNWAFSYGRFFGGKLKFPPSSFHQIALELSSEGDKVHHAMFEPPTTVRYECTETVADNDFSLRPEFEGFDDQQYLQWFKANRVKRKGLPVYKSADATIGNRMRDAWVGVRQMMIDSAVRIGIKGMARRSR